METQITAYQKATKKVEEIEQEIEVTRTSTFYDNFGKGEAERQEDICKLRRSLRAAITDQKEKLDALIVATVTAKQEADNQLQFLNSVIC